MLRSGLKPPALGLKHADLRQVKASKPSALGPKLAVLVLKASPSVDVAWIGGA